MRFTGERVIPLRYDLKPMYQEHIIRYEFASPYMQGKDVIDLGCGCGYGTHLLVEQGAGTAIGVDISVEAIKYSRKYFQNHQTIFRVMDVTRLDYPDNTFGGIVCLEVFEHVADYRALLSEASRVLTPGGTIILSTPNKAVWSPNQETPINPWHIREFGRDEFGGLMEEYFCDVHYWSQTNDSSNIVPFILFNLKLQRIYAQNRSIPARLVEFLHNTTIKLAMIPPSIIPGAMSKNPNKILPEAEVAPEQQHYFVAVATKSA